MTSNPPSPCALCKKTKILQRSHIIPAFAYKWLKQSGGSPIRRSTSPNRRVQDGLKPFLLCQSCEQIISHDEKLFSEKLFKPLTKDYSFNTRYGPWMLRFAAGLSFKLLSYYRSQVDEKNLDSVGISKDCELILREFLLKDRPSPGSFEQHFFLNLPIASTTDANIPENYHRWALRSLEFDMPHNAAFCLTYVKIGPFAFFGNLSGSKLLWKGTRISINGSPVRVQRIILPMEMRDYLYSRMHLHASTLNDLSPYQLRKIDQTTLENLDAFASSNQWQAMELDARLFGEEAIVRRPR